MRAGRRRLLVVSATGCMRSKPGRGFDCRPEPVSKPDPKPSDPAHLALTCVVVALLLPRLPASIPDWMSCRSHISTRQSGPPEATRGAALWGVGVQGWGAGLGCRVGVQGRCCCKGRVC